MSARRPNRGPRRLRLATAALAMALTLPAAARAAGPGPFEGIAGWEGSSRDQGYAFATLGALVPGGPTFVFPVRLTGSWLAYTYDSSSTGVRVRAPGASLMAGVRVSGPRGSLTVTAGGEVRREHRELAAPGLMSRDRTVGGAVVQLEGDTPLSPRWRVLGLANYAGAARYTYARGALRWQANNLDWQGPRVFFVGVEGVGQGNGDSQGWQAGGFAECDLVRQRVSLGLHAGYRESGSGGVVRQTGAYAGAGLYRRF